VSVLVVAEFYGDVPAFMESLVMRADEYRAWMEKSKRAGAIHHRFGVTDKSVVIVDEWESEAAFHAFFQDQDLLDFIAEVGASPQPPSLTIAEAIESPDQY
jgi:hypothetical protein